MRMGLEGWGRIIGTAATIVTIIVAAISLGLLFISQMNAQRAELRAEQRADVAEIRADIATLADRTDAQRAELRADIATLADRTDAQRAEVRAEQRADVAEIRADIATLADRIDASGTRVTQIELDQARQDAAADILLRQIHTHTGDN